MPAKVLPGQRKSVNHSLNFERERLTRLRVVELEMRLAKERGELVERKLIAAQAMYLLTCLRQQILAVPGSWAPRLYGLKSVHEVAEALRGLSHEWLETAAKLPETISDPDWFSKVTGDGEEPQEEERVKPMAPGEAKRQAEKTSRRREAKTQTMRKLRAESA